MSKKQMIAAVLSLIMMMSVAAFAASKTVTLNVDGMHCGNCAASIEKKLKATEGVQEVKVDFDKKEAWVKYDDEKLTVEKIQEAINSTGFKAGGEKKAAE